VHEHWSSRGGRGSGPHENRLSTPQPDNFDAFWDARLTAQAKLPMNSNAASVRRVNGQEVVGICEYRQTVIDDAVSKRLTLN
jgi:hypothetical protein